MRLLIVKYCKEKLHLGIEIILVIFTNIVCFYLFLFLRIALDLAPVK